MNLHFREKAALFENNCRINNYKYNEKVGKKIYKWVKKLTKSVQKMLAHFTYTLPRPWPI